MPDYNGFQSILNAALGSWQHKGYHLVESGDHTLCLYWQDEPVAVFSQTGATIPMLHEACAAHHDLTQTHSDGCGVLHDVVEFLSREMGEGECDGQHLQ